MGILRNLGVYGWEELEDFILASLVTGDGLLMVGSHGAAKTFCAYRIAEALGIKFQKIDASKAEFEDYLGFPNPKALSKGKFECVPTPISVFDKEFVFVDEINRAKPHTQNKLLEVIYSRQIMGLPIEAKWVWGAMNMGEEYSGLEPLDAAFAGRFAWILPVPKASAMNSGDLRTVILSEGPEDALALSTVWRNEPRKNGINKVNGDLKKLLKAASKEYTKIEKPFGQAIASWLEQIVKACSSAAKLELDGRRLSMIRRNILSVVAVRRAQGISDEIPGDLHKLFKRLLPFSVPNIVLGAKFDGEKITKLVDAVNEDIGARGEYFQIITQADIVQKIAAIIKSKMDMPLKTKMFLEAIESCTPFERFLMASALVPVALLRDSPMPLTIRTAVIERIKLPERKPLRVSFDGTKELDQINLWLERQQRPKNAMEEIAWCAATAFAGKKDDLEDRCNEAMRFLKICKREFGGFLKNEAAN
ncbi:MAG: AAA family ATPase [Elusimicrobia bacterium]|nr:AAA family ATPase [Elusimicrobiota bacterium]